MSLQQDIDRAVLYARNCEADFRWWLQDWARLPLPEDFTDALHDIEQQIKAVRNLSAKKYEPMDVRFALAIIVTFEFRVQEFYTRLHVSLTNEVMEKQKCE